MRNYRKELLTIILAFLNIMVASVVSFLKLPLYLDSIGTIIASTQLGLRHGIAVAIISNIILTFTASPTYISYTGTAITIAIISYLLKRFKYLESLVATVVGGIIIGIISAVVSAPITAFLYGGVSLSGTDAFIAFFRQIGHNILESVILGGLSTDPIDKLVSSLIAYSLLKTIFSDIKNA